MVPAEARALRPGRAPAAGVRKEEALGGRRGSGHRADVVWENFRPGIGSEALGSADVRYVAGVGPRIDLPIGPLRVDFTWPFRPSPGSPLPHGEPGIQFAIGPSF